MSFPRKDQRLSLTVRTVTKLSTQEPKTLTPAQESELRRRRAVFFASVNESRDVEVQ